MWSRKELIELMGMDDADWEKGSHVRDLLSTLHQQRNSDIDAKDVDGRYTGYYYAARLMFQLVFRINNGTFYDARRKAMWYLGWKGPKEREYPGLEVESIFFILQRSRNLQVYMYPPGQPAKRIAKFDMMTPEHRQSFVEIRRLTAEKFPSENSSTTLVRKDLLRVQKWHKGGRQRRNAARREPRPKMTSLLRWPIGK